MDLLANDLSIHEQFQDLDSFRCAIVRLMAMRAVAHRFDLEVYCSREFLNAQAMPGVSMQRVVQRLSVDERRSLMLWLTRHGPFWDDLRKHDSYDWLEYQGSVVTDHAVGEAAYRALHAVPCSLISVTPSDWVFSPVPVVWRCDDGNVRHTSIVNYWEQTALEDALRRVEDQVRSWGDLRRVSRRRFDRLVFAKNCFDPLLGIPFSNSGVDRFLVLFDILNQLARHGVRTPAGQRIHRNYFTGENALFSDSSDREKREFRSQLRFPDPRDSQKSLFCTWHGKVRHMTLRLHYWWSGDIEDRVYIVYAGPKITRR